MNLPRVLVADCPWKFGDNLPGAKRGAAKHYPCMRVDELCRFPLPDLAPDALLFFWRVAAMQEEAFRVVRAWGFMPKSELVWRKLTKERPQRHIAELFGGYRTPETRLGMGRYVRHVHEVCLIATRGRPKVRNRAVRSVFDAPAGAHSAKPDRFYEIVERLAEGPYVELFARRSRPGWICLGNEVDAPGTALGSVA